MLDDDEKKPDTGEGLIIVGGSYAGAQIAASARDAGYAGRIRLVSAEAHPPYHRPPLSKAYLLGKAERDSLPIRGAAFYEQEKVELLLSTPIVAADRTNRTLTTSGGDVLRWDRLALATGARARTLPGVPDKVLTLRDLADADRLRDIAANAQRLVVIGGGYIGLEAAASLSQLGKKVSVVEMQDRLLARAATPALAQFVAEAHRARGVELLFGARDVGFEHDRGILAGVRATDAAGHVHILPADLAVVGIGVVPNTELAATLGLAVDDGIRVDEFARCLDASSGAALPEIVAAGDCTRHPSRWNPVQGMGLRLESVQNATDQAKTAGATIASSSSAKPYDAVPWFWSDQFDLKLQMVGLTGIPDATVTRGDMASSRFSLFHFRAGALVGVDSVNKPADHMLARRLLVARASLTPEQAADAAFDLRSVLPT
ncbi:MAG: FAD-dependent oxidoreductase [Alphaproteobacteria bacterium]|nr:FAD-dependent oxidoreductase [Alphaproteobacteria bacterium]MCW5740866.1 FAD-dependent oxidoreductase [Alphaproteobacteria bacterium]